MEPLGENAVACFPQRLRKHRTADHAAVDERHLQRAVASSLTWSGDPAVDGNSMTLDVRDLNKLFEELVPVQVAKPDGKVLGGRQAENLTLVTNAGEGDVGMGHSQDLDLLKNVR